jgi:hypothetical protein
MSLTDVVASLPVGRLSATAGRGGLVPAGPAVVLTADGVASPGSPGTRRCA